MKIGARIPPDVGVAGRAGISVQIHGASDPFQCSITLLGARIVHVGYATARVVGCRVQASRAIKRIIAIE